MHAIASIFLFAFIVSLLTTSDEYHLFVTCPSFVLSRLGVMRVSVNQVLGHGQAMVNS